MAEAQQAQPLAAFAAPQPAVAAEWLPLAARERCERWKPVTLSESRVFIAGGFADKEMAADVKNIEVHGRSYKFVKLDKNALWFLRGVGGPKCAKGELRTVEVIELLRSTMRDSDSDTISSEAADSQGNSQAAVAGDNSQQTQEDVDPMDALDELPAPKQPPTKKRNIERTLIQKIEVPCRPRGSSGSVHVWMYQAHNTNKKQAIYIRSDCLNWLLCYAADEHHFMGVPEPEARPAVAEEANCPEVPDLRLDWQFSTKAWSAKFVALGAKLIVLSLDGH